MPISGLLTRYDFDGGWPAVFYSFGKNNSLQNNLLRYRQVTFAVNSSPFFFFSEGLLTVRKRYSTLRSSFILQVLCSYLFIQKLYRSKCKLIGPLIKIICSQEYCRERSKLLRLTLLRSHFNCFQTGVFGILWYVAWYVLAFESPSAHPTITEYERSYIELSAVNMDEVRLELRYPKKHFVIMRYLQGLPSLTDCDGVMFVRNSKIVFTSYSKLIPQIYKLHYNSLSDKIYSHDLQKKVYSIRIFSPF